MSELHVVGGVSTDWIIGWKTANVALASDLRTLRFSPAAISSSAYGVDALASCRMFGDIHTAPHDSCKCGFNSWNEYDTAVSYMKFHQAMRVGYAFRYYPRSVFRLSLALLRVGMYDEVVEGTLDAGTGWEKWGFRASRQLVSDVFFYGKCAACNAKARYVCATAKTRINDEELYPLATFCAKHAAYGHYILQLPALSRHNDVGIYRELPSE